MGFLHAFLPMHEINEFIFEIKDNEPNSNTFEENYVLFESVIKKIFFIFIL